MVRKSEDAADPAMSGLWAAPGAWEFTGGVLCLDFSNTVMGRDAGQPRDRLPDYAALVAWARRAEILSREEERSVLEAALQRPEAARAAHRQAVGLREAIYAIFAAVSAGQAPESEALDIVNHALSKALAQAQVVPVAGGFAWGWRVGGTPLDHMLWPIARSAGELLTAQELTRVRQCAADCAWLFLDTSKNHSRRWCAMQVCGNRAKARRHYARRRKGKGDQTKAG